MRSEFRALAVLEFKGRKRKIDTKRKRSPISREGVLRGTDKSYFRLILRKFDLRPFCQCMNVIYESGVCVCVLFCLSLKVHPGCLKPSDCVCSLYNFSGVCPLRVKFHIFQIIFYYIYGIHINFTLLFDLTALEFLASCLFVSSTETMYSKTTTNPGKLCNRCFNQK